jgi:hypothetical protein
MPTVTASVEVDVEVEVWCGTCGDGLCRTVNVRGNSITVSPCERCIEDAKRDGYNSGYDDGVHSMEE